MEKRATMHQVAELAGVSQATVSLVLNGVANARISRLTRRRVQEAAEALGYRRGPGHKLPAGRHRVIGLFIDEISTTPLAAPLIEGARDEAALQDIIIATFCTGNNPVLEQAGLDMLVAHNAIGVIYSTLMTREVIVPEQLSRLPLILLNCYEKRLRYPSVVPGDLVGGFTATETLIRAGHSRIAHLAGEHVIEAAIDREKGYRMAMQKWGLPVEDGLVTLGGWTIQAGRERALALLSQPNRPTAIFCYCDRMAIGCYEAARMLGLSIPGDLSIVGFDDEDIAANMDPPLTTILLPHDEMARWAVSQLLDSFEDADADQRMQKTKLECELVTRNSVAPPRT